MPGRSVFLDFDGTLVDIAATPDAIRTDPQLPALIDALARRLEGRLAIISGRSIRNLEAHLGPLDVAVAGSHGSAIRAAGSQVPEYFARPIPIEAETALRQFAAGRDELLVETKPFGVALHYRLAPEAEGEVLALAQSLAETLALSIKRGKMVVELLNSGIDKGKAVDRIMEMTAFRGSQPLFLGDDITDEDAFITALAHDGGGILVGPERETAAIWRLENVANVHAWLKAALT